MHLKVSKGRQKSRKENNFVQHTVDQKEEKRDHPILS